MQNEYFIGSSFRHNWPFGWWVQVFSWNTSLNRGEVIHEQVGRLHLTEKRARRRYDVALVAAEKFAEQLR